MLALLRMVRTRPVNKSDWEPTVTVVIAARNEEQIIENRIKNILGQEYPAEKIEVVVVSDGSTDRTVEVLDSLEFGSVKVVALANSQGKAMAVNEGVLQAGGEIIVFTDARQKFAPDAIKQLVANFTDQGVGCVSGELFFLQDGESSVAAEMGAYWKYEKWIRKAEGQTGSVVGATGAIYAIRRALYRPLSPGTLLDDVMTPLVIAQSHFRVVFEGGSHAFDIVSKDVSQEWKRKVRTLAGNWQLLSLRPSLLFPWCNPLWWRFLSHKIARLLVPFAMIGALAASCVLDGLLYRMALTGQLLLYVAAAAAGTMPQIRKVKLLNLCYFLVVMNLAALVGFWRWVTGQSATAWKAAHAGGAVK